MFCKWFGHIDPIICIYFTGRPESRVSNQTVPTWITLHNKFQLKLNVKRLCSDSDYLFLQKPLSLTFLLQFRKLPEVILSLVLFPCEGTVTGTSPSPSHVTLLPYISSHQRRINRKFSVCSFPVSYQLKFTKMLLL